MTRLRHSSCARVRSSGEVASIPPRDLLGGAPRKQDLSVANRVEAAGPAGDGRLHVVHPPHGEPQPGQHLLALVVAAGGGEDVPVSAGVDHHLRLHGEAPLLAVQHHSAQAIALDDGVARPDVEQRAHAGLFDHCVEGELHLVGVEGNGVPHAVRSAAPHQSPAGGAPDQVRVVTAPLLGRRKPCRVAMRQALGQLLAQAPHHLLSAPVVERQQQDDHAAGGEPAEVAVTLDEHHVGAVSRRCHRSGHPGRAAPHDEDLGLVPHRRLARRLLQRRSGRLGHVSRRWDVSAAGGQSGRRSPSRASRARPASKGTPVSMALIAPSASATSSVPT